MGRDIRWHLAAAGLVGIGLGLLTPLLTPVAFAPSLAWDGAALVFLILTWGRIWRFDADETRSLASAEAPNRLGADVVVVAASLLSLVTVVLVLFAHRSTTGTPSVLRAALGIVSVVLAWAVVHTIYTLRYARMYYAEPEGGIDFNGPEAPAYTDFAYVAFGVGMAFQVADTNVQTAAFRRVVIAHALLSFVFSTMILAVTINLVAGLNATPL